jgi:HEAT repeat protein
MLAGEDSGVRAEGARVIGLADSPALAALLVPLFDDASLEVRLNAIRAAGQLSHHDLLPHLIRKLNDKTTTSAAVETLVKYRDDIEADLSAALETAESSASHIPHILQDRRTRSAVETLLTHFYTADETVRGEIYRALGRMRSEGAEFHLSEARLREAVASELRRGYEWIVVREDLGEEGLDILLADALQVRLNRAVDRVFYLLHLLYPQYTGQIQRVRGALGAEGGNTRAMAVELLDNLAERGTKELLLPLVEAPVETILAVAHKRFDIERRSKRHRLKELAEGPDLWLRACAIFRIGTLKRTELADSVQAALASNDPLLCETALLASRALNPSTSLRTSLQPFDFA